MKAIFACKLYKSSSRQAKIKAALADPVNKELVEQLEEYIGDEYKEPEQGTVPKRKALKTDPETKKSDTAGSSAAPVFIPKDKEPSDGFAETDDNLEEEPEAAEDTPVAFTKKVNGLPIKADTATDGIPLTENHVLLAGLSGELKGTLNGRAGTHGVTRVSVKSKEVWVYYNDDTNLNDVMTPVIELLNAASYSYLIFNRLARTDNAIVFTINTNDTNNVMRPAAEIGNE